MQQGFVYCLVNDSIHGVVKIGFTCTPVEKRVKDLYGTNVPTPYRCFCAKFMQNPYACEQQILKAFEPFKFDGREFLRIDPRVIQCVMQLFPGVLYIRDLAYVPGAVVPPEFVSPIGVAVTPVEVTAPVNAKGKGRKKTVQDNLSSTDPSSQNVRRGTKRLKNPEKVPPQTAIVRGVVDVQSQSEPHIEKHQESEQKPRKRACRNAKKDAKQQQADVSCAVSGAGVAIQQTGPGRQKMTRIPKHVQQMIVSFHQSQVAWEERTARLGMTVEEIEHRMILIHKKEPFLSEHHALVLKNRHVK